MKINLILKQKLGEFYLILIVYILKIEFLIVLVMHLMD